jgi:hypothetical protein
LFTSGREEGEGSSLGDGDFEVRWIFLVPIERSLTLLVLASDRACPNSSAFDDGTAINPEAPKVCLRLVV